MEPFEEAVFVDLGDIRVTVTSRSGGRGPESGPSQNSGPSQQQSGQQGQTTGSRTVYEPEPQPGAPVNRPASGYYEWHSSSPPQQSHQQQQPLPPCSQWARINAHQARTQPPSTPAGETRYYCVFHNPFRLASEGIWIGTAPAVWREIEAELKGQKLAGSGAYLRRAQSEREAREMWDREFRLGNVAQRLRVHIRA
jgi:hypothetical protein